MSESPVKFERLIKILRQLSLPDGCTTQQLADLIGANVRSIQRDIQFLSEKCFDIVQDRRHGPYRLKRPLDIHGQTLGLEEVLGLVLGLALLEQPLGETGQEAGQKLQHLVKSDKKIAARELPRSIAAAQLDEGTCLPALMRALSLRRRVRFLYRKPELSHRILDPYALLYQDGRLYVQGFDQDRQALRCFRLKRIEQLEILDSPFEVPSDYKPERFHKWDLAPGPGNEIRCKVSDALAHWLMENPVHPSQTLSDNILQMKVRDLNALANWIQGLQGVEVLHPPELRGILRQRALETVAAYA